MKNRDNVAEKPDVDVNLPPELVRQIRAFEKRLCVMETIVALLGGIGALLLTYLLVFISDRLWDTPSWMRLPLAVGGALVLTAFLYHWFRYWLLHRRSRRDLVKLVQRRYTRLGDRLLGAVELAESGAVPGVMSPALCRAAIRQVAAESTAFDFKGAVNVRKPRTVAVVFIVLLFAVLLPLLLFPSAGVNALMRWVKPLGDVERYTFVSLQHLPDEQIVPHGEDFAIVCRLAEESRWKPVAASCRFEGQPTIVATVRDGLAEFRVPGQTQIGALKIRIGDVTRFVRIVPVFRSEMVRMVATVRFPEYLERGVTNVVVENGNVSFVNGSRVALRGEVDREVKDAFLGRLTERYSLDVSGPSFVTEESSVEEVGACEFTWTDRYGLTCAAPYLLDTVSVEDEAPLIEARGMSRVVAILEDEVVDLDLAASDDYGVKRLWVEWHSIGKPEKGIESLNGSVSVSEGGATVSAVEGAFSFSPIVFHVPEESTVTIEALALDYYPEREPVRSRQYRIYVLSRAEHARLIQEQMQRLQAKIEDMAREEERLIQSNSELQLRPEAELKSEKSTSDIRENELAETDNARDLDQMSREGENLIKEALRNKDITEQTLKDWAEMVQSMRDVAGGEMQKAAESLSKARSQPGQRKEELEDAIASEKRALEALREMESDMNETMESMLAQSFINRLRAVAGVERAIGGALHDLIPKSVGIRMEELALEVKDELGVTANRQEDNREQVAFISDDLSGFYNRTRQDVYNEIHLEMKATNIVEELGVLAGRIRRNESGQSMKAALHWEKQLLAWADRLEAQKQAGGGGGEGGGEPEQVDVEIIIGLMRLRVQEETIRENTRVLEMTKDENRRYSSDSRRLSDRQNDLVKDVRPLERRVKSDKVRAFIEKIGGEMMNAGVYLRRPQTDASTIAIQTEIIELIAAALNSASSQGGSESQGVMQGLAMGTQPGAGSNAGGTTDRENVKSGGDAAGPGGEARDIDKAGGLGGGELPAEFRDVIEAYFKAVEEME